MGHASILVLALLALVVATPLVLLVASGSALRTEARAASWAASWLRLVRSAGEAGPLGRLDLAPVCLEGRAEALEVARSPVEGRDCLAWGVEVRAGLRRAAVVRDEEVVRFRLVGETGCAVVDGRDATGFYPTLPALGGRWLSRVPPDDRLGQGGRWAVLLGRATEWRLEPGEPCTVVGAVVGREVEGEGSGYRRVAERPLVGRGAEGLLVAAGSRADLVETLRRDLAFHAVRACVAGLTLGSLAALLAALPGPFHAPASTVLAFALACAAGTVGLAAIGTAGRLRRRPPLPAPR